MKEYSCKACKYKTADCSNWNKHLKTKNHEKWIKAHEKAIKMAEKLKQKTVITEQKFACEYCGKEYTRKDNMKTHQKNCTKKTIQPEVLEMFDELKKAINNNTTNNKSTNIMGDLPPITEESLKAHLEKLTLDLIQEGAKGYAMYASTYALKDYVICTDKSRKKLKFKEEDGTIVNDLGGVKITQIFFDSIKDKNKILIDKEYDLLQKEVARIGAGGEAGVNDLTNALEKSTMLQNLLYQCNDAAIGKTNALTQAFVRHLTKAL